MKYHPRVELNITSLVSRTSLMFDIPGTIFEHVNLCGAVGGNFAMATDKFVCICVFLRCSSPREDYSPRTC